MQRRGDLSRIKLDLTNDEKIVLDPEMRKVYHPYSDILNSSITVQAYCLEEIFAEKLRALAERLRPRDLYDVIHLHRDKRWQPNRKKLTASLQSKCDYKQIKLPTMNLLAAKLEQNELAAEWNNMLAHQVGNLPSFDHYWQQLPAVLNWIYGKK